MYVYSHVSVYICISGYGAFINRNHEQWNYSHPRTVVRLGQTSVYFMCFQVSKAPSTAGYAFSEVTGHEFKGSKYTHREMYEAMCTCMQFSRCLAGSCEIFRSVKAARRTFLSNQMNLKVVVTCYIPL